jgi:hypothetical protein
LDNEKICNDNCFSRARQDALLALSLALFNAGSNIPARIAMIAITTRSSMRVKQLPIENIIGS